jgi:Ulp1 family protease
VYNYLSEQGWIFVDVLDMLDQVAWSGKVKGFSRNATVEKTALAGLASRGWLNDDHIHMAVDILRSEMEEEGVEGVATTILQGGWFFKRLCNVYGEQDRYRDTNNCAYRWIRNIGHKMATGSIQHLGLVLHQGNHWPAVVIDVKRSMIQFGDSLHGSIPEKVKTTLLWWTRFHTGKGFNISTVMTSDRLYRGIRNIAPVQTSVQ